MLKQLCQITQIVAQKEIHLLCENDTPVELIETALTQFIQYLGKVKEAHNAQKEALNSSVTPTVTEESSSAEVAVDSPKVETFQPV